MQNRKDELDRIPIEGIFGQGKRHFSLARIMCKLATTSETAITVAFIVMNLEKWLKSLFFSFFYFSMVVKSVPMRTKELFSQVQKLFYARFIEGSDASSVIENLAFA